MCFFIFYKMEDEVRNRKEETPLNKELPKEEEKPHRVAYDVETDPQFHYIFVILRVVVVVLAYFCFQLAFNTFIRPLFVSVDERIGIIVASLRDQWCRHGECTEEDEKTIQAIVKNIKDSGRFFW